jgi:hypothetical protein
MVKFGSARTARLVQFGCGLLAAGSVAAFDAPGAFAGPLEGVTGPVTQAVVEPVREATGAVTSPVQEVTEAVTQPVPEATEVPAPPVHEAAETVAPTVKEATETVTRPAKEATETVTRPAQEVTEAVKPPVKVHVPTGTSGSSSSGAVKSAAGAAHEVTRTATHTAEDAIGAVVTDAARSGRSSPGGDRATEGANRGAANDAVASPGPGSSNATAGLGAGIFVVPPGDGSVRAPLPKWMAYVWPAIALMRPALADLLGRWERESLRLASGTGTGSGSGGGPVVAGVHASGGRPAAAEAADSSSPFSKIPSALGDAFSPDVPTSAWAYLCLAAFAVIAVAAAVRREITVGRRQGRGR